MIPIHVYLKTARPRSFKADGSAYYDCPRCNGRKKLEVSASGLVWHCHKEGVGSRLPGRQAKGYQEETLPDDVKLEPIGPDNRGWLYLKYHRGLPDKRIRDLRPMRGPNWLRVYFPIYDLGRDEPCYWIARATTPYIRGPIYLNPKQAEGRKRKTEVLWGLHRIRYGVENLLLMEGVFDAIWYDGAVALLGKTLSSEKLYLIKRIAPESVTVVLDGDAVAESAKVVGSLCRSYQGRIYQVQLPPSRDPDGGFAEPYLARRRRRVA